MAKIMTNHSISKINMGTFKKIVPENYFVWKYLSVTLLFPSYSLQKHHHHHNCVKTRNGREWRAWRIVFWKSGMSLVPWTKWSIWNNSFLNCGCNWKEEAWKKKSGLQRDSNPWPLRYRCVALPTELWSHTLGARSIYWVHISREEWNDVKYMK